MDRVASQHLLVRKLVVLLLLSPRSAVHPALVLVDVVLIVLLLLLLLLSLPPLQPVIDVLVMNEYPSTSVFEELLDGFISVSHVRRAFVSGEAREEEVCEQEAQ